METMATKTKSDGKKPSGAHENSKKVKNVAQPVREHYEGPHDPGKHEQPKKRQGAH
jgi:hypothetical protein